MERLVNVNTLLCLLACRASKGLFLRSCQINKLQLAHCDVILVMQILRFNSNRKNAVRTRREVVKVMACQDSVPRSIFIQVKHFFGIGRFKHVQVLNNELVLFSPANS